MNKLKGIQWYKYKKKKILTLKIKNLKKLNRSFPILCNSNVDWYSFSKSKFKKKMKLEYDIIQNRNVGKEITRVWFDFEIS